MLPCAHVAIMVTHPVGIVPWWEPHADSCGLTGSQATAAAHLHPLHAGGGGVNRSTWTYSLHNFFGGTFEDVSFSDKALLPSSIYVVWGSPDDLQRGSQGIAMPNFRLGEQLVVKVGVGEGQVVPGSRTLPGIHQRMMPFAKLFDVEGGAVIGDAAYGEHLAQRLEGQDFPWEPIPKLELA